MVNEQHVAWRHGKIMTEINVNASVKSWRGGVATAKGVGGKRNGGASTTSILLPPQPAVSTLRISCHHALYPYPLYILFSIYAISFLLSHRRISLHPIIRQQ